MLVVELINRAYVLAGIVARDLDQVEGSEGRDGLFWINQLLDEMSMTGRYIPYESYTAVTAVIGQEIYNVPGLVILETMTFNIGDVRYEMRRDNRRHYFGAPRVDNILALPFHYYSERVVGGTNVYLYFKPQSAYVLKIKGKSALGNVTNDTELDLVVDKFYQSYLMYLLAERLCDWFKLSFPPSTKQKLREFENQLRDLNPIDFTTTKISTLAKGASISYAQANIGKGWTAP